MAATNAIYQNAIYNVWNMAAPTLSAPFSPTANLTQSQATNVNTYENFVNSFVDYTGNAKSYFAQYNIYQNAYPQLNIYPYQYGSPRPFQTQTAVAGNPWTVQEVGQTAYDIQQTPGPGESWAQLDGSPSFPSGHSTRGNIVGIATAIAAPQYYKDFLLAGVEFAYSRQVFGAHYPLDSIGGRLVAMYSLAEQLNGTDGFTQIDLATITQATEALQALVGSVSSSPYAAACEGNVIGCIRAGAIPTAAQFAADRANYTWYLTYDLPSTGPTNLAPVVPAGAEVLIATRFPYLTQAQLTEVLATTEIASGSALDNGSGWARLNLYAAADGFGAFNSNETVTMNAAAGGYNAFDVWANNITGSGGLTLAGTGTLVLAGDSTYSGGTNVAGGTLAVTGSIEGAVDVANGAMFYNAGTVTALGDSVVTNNGTLVNDGTIASTVANAGTATNNGTIAGSVVNTGTFVNPGTITGSVANSGAFNDNGIVGGSFVDFGLLSGNGTIGGALTIAQGGVVAPGNSIGTLHVGGNVVFQPGSTYAVQIDAGGASDLIQAGGSAAINGGAVQVSVGSGVVVGLNTFTILTANGGVSGQFTAINDPFGTNYPFLDAALVYGANGISLISTRSSVPLASVAQNANQAAVARALDTIPATGPLVNAIVSLNAATAPAAFTALSGGIYPSIDTVLQAQSVYLRDAVTGRLRQAFAAPAAPAVGPKTAQLVPGLIPTVWTQAYGSWGDGEGGDGVADVSRSIGGFVTGLDNPIGDTARIGFAGGYSQSQFKAGSLASSGESDNYDVALYGGAKFGALGLRLGASYTWHDLSVNRSVAFQGFSEALSSSYDAGTTQVFAEAGYGIATPYADLEPFAGIAYVSLHTDAMSETGGAAGLQSGSSTQDNTFTTLGLRAAKGFAVNGGTLTASASLGWQYAFGDTTPVSTLSFEAGGSAFQETGIPIARNAALVGVGFDFTATPNVTIGLHYAGQLAGSSQDNAVDGRVSIKF
ncbi:autotransporter domain-containing protein [Segnochrobactrum spirostomi]|uniref:autotransporter domain-containing protein n=1 Tax=Segnochrobactrum spirostomi TaxID=2608987 RepID=UPI001AD846C4|nr:autotransporter domain-containing protein [Segnochrobactrum spirostomi]